MSRNTLAALLAALLAAPSLGAPVEIPRLETAPSGLGAASSAGAAVTALSATTLLAPSAAPTAAPAAIAPAL